MCLGIPGEIVSTFTGEGGLRMARVRFSTVEREICLVYTPEAGAGDHVIVHAGFAVERLGEDEARQLADLLDQIEAAPQGFAP